MTTDNAKLLTIKKNLKETSTYFRRKKEDVLNYLIEKSNTTGKLPKELHIRRFELNTTFLNELSIGTGITEKTLNRFLAQDDFSSLVNQINLK